MYKTNSLVKGGLNVEVGRGIKIGIRIKIMSRSRSGAGEATVDSSCVTFCVIAQIGRGH